MMENTFLFTAMFFAIQCFSQNELDFFAKAEKFFIAKKGGTHNFNDMQPEMQQFVDWFDLYLK